GRDPAACLAAAHLQAAGLAVGHWAVGRAAVGFDRLQLLDPDAADVLIGLNPLPGRALLGVQIIGPQGSPPVEWQTDEPITYVTTAAKVSAAFSPPNQVKSLTLLRADTEGVHVMADDQAAV